MAVRCTAGCPKRFERRDWRQEVAIPGRLTEDDIAGLPATVQRYLHAMGVVNRPRDWSFQAHITGRFRLRGQGSWMPAEVWQYNSAVEVARFFHMRSELVTYLNDAVLMAPSMLLRPNTAFSPVDDHAFDVTLVDAGQTVTARVFLDDDGRPGNFSTTDRYADLPGGLVRAEWTTPIDGWQPDGDRLVFTRGSAVWQLPEGPLTYLDFRIPAGGVQYNVEPADIMDAST